VLKPAQMPSAYHSISESACELIPILYSLSPTFIDAANLGTIELGLVVINLLCALIEEFSMDSKTECDQLNLAHETKT